MRKCHYCNVSNIISPSMGVRMSIVLVVIVVIVPSLVKVRARERAIIVPHCCPYCPCFVPLLMG